jgi:hypothetical protein
VSSHHQGVVCRVVVVEEAIEDIGDDKSHNSRVLVRHAGRPAARQRTSW